MKRVPAPPTPPRRAARPPRSGCRPPTGRRCSRWPGRNGRGANGRSGCRLRPTPVERKSEVRTAVIQGKHLPSVMNDEQRAPSSLNDDHTLRLSSSSVPTRMKASVTRLFVKFGHSAHPIEPFPTRRERRTGVFAASVQHGSIRRTAREQCNNPAGDRRIGPVSDLPRRSTGAAVHGDGWPRFARRWSCPIRFGPILRVGRLP